MLITKVINLLLIPSNSSFYVCKRTHYSGPLRNAKSCFLLTQCKLTVHHLQICASCVLVKQWRVFLSACIISQSDTPHTRQHMQIMYVSATYILLFLSILFLTEAAIEREGVSEFSVYNWRHCQTSSSVTLPISCLSL